MRDQLRGLSGLSLPAVGLWPSLSARQKRCPHRALRGHLKHLGGFPGQDEGMQLLGHAGPPRSADTTRPLLTMRNGAEHGRRMTHLLKLRRGASGQDQLGVFTSVPFRDGRALDTARRTTPVTKAITLLLPPSLDASEHVPEVQRAQSGLQKERREHATARRATHLHTTLVFACC